MAIMKSNKNKILVVLLLFLVFPYGVGGVVTAFLIALVISALVFIWSTKTRNRYHIASKALLITPLILLVSDPILQNYISFQLFVGLTILALFYDRLALIYTSDTTRKQ